jgi:hypothetical protein
LNENRLWPDSCLWLWLLHLPTFFKKCFKKSNILIQRI